MTGHTTGSITDEERTMASRKRRRNRRHRSPLGFVVPVLAGAGLLIGGATALAPEAGGVPSAACALVIDRTPLPADDTVREQMRAGAERTLDGCARLDAELHVLTVTAHGSEVSTLGTFPLYPEASRSTSLRDRSRQERLDAASERLTAVLDQEVAVGPAGANVLRGVDAAADHLRRVTTEHELERAHLVVVSGGYQSSDAVSVAQLTEDPASVDQLSEATRASGLLTDLDGVRVDLIGVGGGVADDGSALPTWFRRHIDGYWIETLRHAAGSPCHVAPQAPVSLPTEVC